MLNNLLMRCFSGRRWISAQDALQMPAIYGLAANIAKKVLKINDFC